MSLVVLSVSVSRMTKLKLEEIFLSKIIQLLTNVSTNLILCVDGTVHLFYQTFDDRKMIVGSSYVDQCESVEKWFVFV